MNYIINVCVARVDYSKLTGKLKCESLPQLKKIFLYYIDYPELPSFILRRFFKFACRDQILYDWVLVITVVIV